MRRRTSDTSKLTISGKQLLSMTVQDRLNELRNNPSYFEQLTPTELARLFPKQYLQQLPDMGKSLSGGIPTGGRGQPQGQVPSAVPSGPGVGQPSAPRRAPAPGRQAGPSAPEQPPRQQTKQQNDIWESGGTPVVNKSGEIQKRLELGDLIPDNKGNIDPRVYYKEALKKVAGSKLIGFVPEDGERFGITKGTKEEWARFMTQLTKQESNFNVRVIGDKGNSKGLSQMKEGEYGITDPHDPHQAQMGMIRQFEKYILQSKKIAGRGTGPGTYQGWNGVAAYFGPLRRENEFFQHDRWMEKIRPELDTIGEPKEGEDILPSLSLIKKQALEEKKQEQNAAFRIWQEEKAQSVPTPEERKRIFQEGGIVVNLDSNWAKRGVQTGPLVVIPDNATDDQRKAAENYVKQVEELYREQFGKSLPGKVLTRSQNGRGRSNTIHTEAYSVNDDKAVDFFRSPEGRKRLAKITHDTLGNIPGVVFTEPHNMYAKTPDRGAVSEKYGVSEVDLARPLLEELENIRQKAKELNQIPKKLIEGPKEVKRETATPIQGVDERQAVVAGIRTLPLKDELKSYLNYATAETGVNFEVTSGGQTRDKQTGSYRHNIDIEGTYGAADGRLYVEENGQRRYLSVYNKEDLSLINKYIEAYTSVAPSAGIGTDYMGSGINRGELFHIGGPNRPGDPSINYSGSEYIGPGFQRGLKLYEEEETKERFKNFIKQQKEAEERQRKNSVVSMEPTRAPQTAPGQPPAATPPAPTAVPQAAPQTAPAPPVKQRGITDYAGATPPAPTAVPKEPAPPETPPEQQTKGKGEVPQNKYGGEYQASEDLVVADARTGIPQFTFNKDEDLTLKDGRLQVTPDTRNNPDQMEPRNYASAQPVEPEPQPVTDQTAQMYQTPPTGIPSTSTLFPEVMQSPSNFGPSLARAYAQSIGFHNLISSNYPSGTPGTLRTPFDTLFG